MEVELSRKKEIMEKRESRKGKKKWMKTKGETKREKKTGDVRRRAKKSRQSITKKSRGKMR